MFVDLYDMTIMHENSVRVSHSHSRYLYLQVANYRRDLEAYPVNFPNQWIFKSSALLPSNLPSVIDRSNLSPSREAAFHFYFYSNNDPTNILFVKERRWPSG